MNIFYLSNDVKQCAAWHNNKHVVKMILESAQLLSTAHRILDSTHQGVIGSRLYYLLQDEHDVDSLKCYRQTHVNHPSAVWVRKSKHNYKWLYSLFVELIKEYEYRYGKQHACIAYLDFLSKCPDNIGTESFTAPPQCMPDEYKVIGDTVKAYHNYYIGAKQSMAQWKNRDIPSWYA